MKRSVVQIAASTIALVHASAGHGEAPRAAARPTPAAPTASNAEGRDATAPVTAPLTSAREPRTGVEVASAEPEIVVVGRAERRIGSASSASDGAISGDELRQRPMLRTNEIAEAVPGLIAVQHSGGGKAAQYYIRGYSLDHGTDFTIAVDGMPMNLRTHAHGQGYLDLNGLIPEVIDRIEYRKGPYRAADGDFSLVASASLKTLDRVERPYASIEAGSYDYVRLAGVGSYELGGGSLLLASELKANNGPWQLAEHLRHASVFAKYTVETSLGTLRASISDYNAKWRPTEQVPVRAIGVEIPDRFGTLDPYLRGDTSRQIGTLTLDNEHFSAIAYVQHYDFDLISNFTFFLADPINGDELEQAEERWTYGGRVQRRFDIGDRLQVMIGADAQEDRISDLGLYQTRFGRRIRTNSLADVRETSLSGYGQVSWKPVDRLTLTGGARYDHYRFRQRALAGAANDGMVEDDIVTPKASAALEVARGVALYANYGEGFHSNDARGVTASVDPTPGLVRGKVYEFGTRIEQGPVVFTLDHWWARSAGELVYSGDEGTVEPSGPSRRRGIEATLFVRPVRWLTIDAIYATNHARFTDAPDADRIPNSLKSAASLSATVTYAGFDAAVRVRHTGSRPLIEDNSVRGPSTTVVNLHLGKTFGRVEVSADLLNAFNTKRADADYFYASRLPGEPLEGVEGIHSRSVESRQIRGGVKLFW